MTVLSLNAANIEAIAHTLQAVPKVAEPPPIVQAVALKLPTFWLSHPVVWFAQVEVQFAACQPPIDTDLTKYNYVVAAHDNMTAGEVEALLLAPQKKNKYPTLKSALIKAFGKTQAHKDNELLSLSLASVTGSHLPYLDTFALLTPI